MAKNWNQYRPHYHVVDGEGNVNGHRRVGSRTNLGCGNVAFTPNSTPRRALEDTYVRPTFVGVPKGEAIEVPKELWATLDSVLLKHGRGVITFSISPIDANKETSISLRDEIKFPFRAEAISWRLPNDPKRISTTFGIANGMNKLRRQKPGCSEALIYEKGNPHGDSNRLISSDTLTIFNNGVASFKANNNGIKYSVTRIVLTSL